MKVTILNIAIDMFILNIAFALLAILIVEGIGFISKIYRKDKPQKSFSERFSELNKNLIKASSDFDKILGEMAKVAEEREFSIKKLEEGLIDLEKRKNELKERISLLQKVPIPIAEYFAKLIEPSENRSAKRDYLLFISGVIFTTIITLVSGCIW